MIGFFFGAGLVLSCVMVLLLKRKIELIKCAVLGTVYYFMLYIIITGILFLFGQFSLKRITLLLCIILIGACIFFGTIYSKKESIRFLPIEKQSWFSYIVIGILFVLFSGSFGYFGMGQDQGVYQVEAINIANGKNEWLTTFPEYDKLSDKEYKDYYRETVDAIPGVELVDVEYNFREVFGIPKKGELDVIYHAIPTYPAILGLTIKVFGIERMMLSQTLFYLLLLLLLEIVLREHGIHWGMRAILISVLGLSPEVLWLRKSTLTEMFLAVLITYYLYKLLDNEEGQKIFSVFPIVVFSFFHASAFSVFPIFIVNYGVLYLLKKNMKYIGCAIASLVGFLMGFIMMLKVEPIYITKNLIRHFEQIGIQMPYDKLPFLVITFSIILTIGCMSTFFFRRVSSEKVLMIERITISLITVLVAADFLIGRPWWGDLFKPDRWWRDLPLIGTSTLMGFAMLTGFFVVPLLIVGIIIKNKAMRDIRIVLIANLFAWTVLIYSAFMRLRVMSYYYNARYLVPFFPIIIIFYGFLFGYQEWNENGKNRVICVLTTCLPVIGIFLMLPFSNVVRLNQDDTNLQWSTVKDVINNVREGDTVLLDKDEMWFFFYPLRSIGAFVYPVMDDVEKTLQYADIESDNKNLYYISNSQVYEDDWRYEVIYESKSKYQLDDLSHFAKYLRLPTDFSHKGENIHVLYHWVEPDTVIQSTDNRFVKGWTSVNTAGYRWMCDSEAEVNAYLLPGDFQMIIRQGDDIPFELISLDKIELEVLINGFAVDTIQLDASTKGEEFSIFVPSSYLEEGNNHITFKANNMWSPAEYGSEDASSYAVSIGSIQFR